MFTAAAMHFIDYFFFSSRRRHTRCALVTGVQTCALPICNPAEAIAPLREATTKTNYQPLIATTFGHALIATDDKANYPEASCLRFRVAARASNACNRALACSTLRRAFSIASGVGAAMQNPYAE